MQIEEYELLDYSPFNDLRDKYEETIKMMEDKLKKPGITMQEHTIISRQINQLEREYRHIKN